jgi:aminoglycoside phosphotransferase (APT) family kinase protein
VSNPGPPVTTMMATAQSLSSTTHTSTDSTDSLARFASVLVTINTESIKSLASRTRNKRSKRPESGRGAWPSENTHFDECTVIEPPNCGSFNLLYTLIFLDRVKWVLRIPSPGEDGNFTPESSRLLRSDAMTMEFLREHVSMPIPQIYDFDETINNEIGTPYILMQLAEGSPVSEQWFNESGPTPLEARRQRILDTVGAAMSRLHSYWFEQIGSLDFESEGSPPIFTMGPCNFLEEVDMENPNAVVFQKIGPFDTSRGYLESLLSFQPTPQDSFSLGTRHLLKMMIECMPRSVPDKEHPAESFVLAHPDFDSQNVLVSEDGTLTALIDWDNVHTVPRSIGYSRYLAWITRDWDPIKYGYGIPTCRPENSPAELDFYRRRYADVMKSLVPEGNDFASKSHLYEAVWIAASSWISTDTIVRKIFRSVFSEDTPDGDPLYLYETACALAEHRLEKGDEERIRKAFQDLFGI